MAPEAKADQTAVINLARTHGQMYGQLSALLKAYDITEPQFNVLRILRGAGEPGLPCQEISRRMVTQVPDVTRLLDRLERRDLVERQRDHSDRRIVRVTLQPEALRLLARLDQPVQALHARQLGHLSREELTELNRLLVKARTRERQQADHE